MRDLKNVSSELRRVTNNDFQKLKFNLKKILLNNYNNTQSLSIFIDHSENMLEFRIENLDIDKAWYVTLESRTTDIRV